MSDETVNSVATPVETEPTAAAVNAPEATPAEEAIGVLATPNEEASAEASTTEPVASETATTEASAAEAGTTDAPATVDTPTAEPVAATPAPTPVAPTPPKAKAAKTGGGTAQSKLSDPANDLNIIHFEGDQSETERGRRKTRTGRVVSSKMQKTVVVAVETRKRHPLYGKFMRQTAKFKAHDEQNECGEGDTVEIMETRPLSKDKNWRVIRIVEKAK